MSSVNKVIISLPSGFASIIPVGDPPFLLIAAENGSSPPLDYTWETNASLEGTQEEKDIYFRNAKSGQYMALTVPRRPVPQDMYKGTTVLSPPHATFRLVPAGVTGQYYIRTDALSLPAVTETSLFAHSEDGGQTTRGDFKKRSTLLPGKESVWQIKIISA